MSNVGPIRFDNSYVRLGERFFTRIDPEPVPQPSVVRIESEVAELLGFDPEWLASPRGVEVLAGNEVLRGSEPVAMVYAGHQFGSWNPRLGDGRAHLLGEVVSSDGERFDLQLKGSGRTPYSRNGDGRSPLGPALREHVVSEAMAALGIPTTRSLGVVRTGEVVRRATPQPGGIVARVAASHVRVGTFEYFASIGDHDAVRQLAEYVLARHYPEAEPSSGLALTLLNEVAHAQSQLVAQWQLAGFIHGVMNTDNMLVCGETIDYGPCAFMDDYDPNTVFSSIDSRGRYAYSNQPAIAQWNLARLATAILASFGATADEVDAAEKIVVGFAEDLQKHVHRGFVRKLGLQERRDGDGQLIADLLERMHATEADFTLTFRQLSEAAAPDAALCRAGEVAEPLQGWLRRWQRRTEAESGDAGERRSLMEAVNPAVIPRNHLVEAALAAAEAGDDAPFHQLVEEVQRPFDWPSELRYTQPPASHQVVTATFCGT